MLFATFAILAAVPFLVKASIRSQYEHQIFEIDGAPNRRAAIVFGAAVSRGGWLSTILRDRMDTAISLYKRGVIKEIIVSGHQDGSGYDEPGSMMAYAVARGVPSSAIFADTGGDRTYDTCYRAQHEFQLESVILISQDYHLPRALFTCNMLGVEAVGVRADLRTYRGSQWYELRETAATLVALTDLIRREAPGHDDFTAFSRSSSEVATALINQTLMAGS